MLIRKRDADACSHTQESQRTNQEAWEAALPVGSQAELGGQLRRSKHGGSGSQRGPVNYSAYIHHGRGKSTQFKDSPVV